MILSLLLPLLKMVVLTVTRVAGVGWLFTLAKPQELGSREAENT